MKPPEFIKRDKENELMLALSEWHQLLFSIRDQTKNHTNLFSAINKQSNREVALSELTLAQFFTFSSITNLIDCAHYADAYGLLRTLFEGHLHIWNLYIGDKETTDRFTHLSAIQEWRIASEALAVEGTRLGSLYYTDERLLLIKTKYEEAIVYFNCKKGKIPRNYISLTPLQIATQIDEKESLGKPFRQLMSLRLYSAGSEYVHRSLFGIREGYAAIERKSDTTSYYSLAPNPFRGLEASWWSTVIFIDGIDWYLRVLERPMPTVFHELRMRATELAAKSFALPTEMR